MATQGQCTAFVLPILPCTIPGMEIKRMNVMKRNIAHMITVLLTSCILVCHVWRVHSLAHLVWYALDISANVIVIFLLLKNLDQAPKKMDQSFAAFMVAVLSTNLSVFVPMIGGYGPYSDIALLKQIAAAINLATMPWYLFSILSLGKGLTILPEANTLKVTKAYQYSRHPLYLTYIVWKVTQNLVFQSWSVLLISVLQIALIVIRARNEEKVLLDTFCEYAEYKQQVGWLGRRTMKKDKGAFTLEAAIVMSSILIILCAVLYAFMLLYQNVVVTYAASYAAQQGAAAWVNSGLNIEDGSGSYRSEPYYRIAELVGGGHVAQKKQNIENCAREKLKSGILSVKDSVIHVEFKNYVFQRQIHVEIKQNIPIPFAQIAKFFNGGNDFSLSTKAVATVAEPAEYIRNCDYAVETATVLIAWVNEKFHISDGFSKIKSALGALG